MKKNKKIFAAIGVELNIKKKLDGLKIIPSEAYNEVIKRLLDKGD